ncbi:LAMI_0A04126g1_1 [Lachancea mirantina]|uniref:LAMI_0A04126g1_1 n=1 Tax=Lachancea mirantina TaxID=1230905 RepID=A0A1G4IPA6_9SACH|nr:LAMI_0A04126g1_1 [Lachancea mirantina]
MSDKKQLNFTAPRRYIKRTESGLTKRPGIVGNNGFENNYRGKKGSIDNAKNRREVKSDFSDALDWINSAVGRGRDLLKKLDADDITFERQLESAKRKQELLKESLSLDISLDEKEDSPRDELQSKGYGTDTSFKNYEDTINNSFALEDSQSESSRNLDDELSQGEDRDFAGRNSAESVIVLESDDEDDGEDSSEDEDSLASASDEDENEENGLFSASTGDVEDEGSELESEDEIEVSNEGESDVYSSNDASDSEGPHGQNNQDSQNVSIGEDISVDEGDKGEDMDEMNSENSLISGHSSIAEHHSNSASEVDQSEEASEACQESFEITEADQLENISEGRRESPQATANIVSGPGSGMDLELFGNVAQNDAHKVLLQAINFSMARDVTDPNNSRTAEEQLVGTPHHSTDSGGNPIEVVDSLVTITHDNVVPLLADTSTTPLDQNSSEEISDSGMLLAEDSFELEIAKPAEVARHNLPEGASNQPEYNKQLTERDNTLPETHIIQSTTKSNPKDEEDAAELIAPAEKEEARRTADNSSSSVEDETVFYSFVGLNKKGQSPEMLKSSDEPNVKYKLVYSGSPYGPDCEQDEGSSVDEEVYHSKFLSDPFQEKQGSQSPQIDLLRNLLKEINGPASSEDFAEQASENSGNSTSNQQQDLRECLGDKNSGQEVHEVSEYEKEAPANTYNSIDHESSASVAESLSSRVSTGSIAEEGANLTHDEPLKEVELEAMTNELTTQCQTQDHANGIAITPANSVTEEIVQPQRVLDDSLQTTSQSSTIPNHDAFVQGPIIHERGPSDSNSVVKLEQNTQLLVTKSGVIEEDPSESKALAEQVVVNHQESENSPENDKQEKIDEDSFCEPHESDTNVKQESIEKENKDGSNGSLQNAKTAELSPEEHDDEIPSPVPKVEHQEGVSEEIENSPLNAEAAPFADIHHKNDLQENTQTLDSNENQYSKFRWWPLKENDTASKPSKLSDVTDSIRKTFSNSLEILKLVRANEPEISPPSELDSEGAQNRVSQNKHPLDSEIDELQALHKKTKCSPDLKGDVLIVKDTRDLDRDSAVEPADDFKTETDPELELHLNSSPGEIDDKYGEKDEHTSTESSKVHNFAVEKLYQSIEDSVRRVSKYLTENGNSIYHEAKQSHKLVPLSNFETAQKQQAFDIDCDVAFMTGNASGFRHQAEQSSPTRSRSSSDLSNDSSRHSSKNFGGSQSLYNQVENDDQTLEFPAGLPGSRIKSSNIPEREKQFELFPSVQISEDSTSEYRDALPEQDASSPTGSPDLDSHSSERHQPTGSSLIILETSASSTTSSGVAKRTKATGRPKSQLKKMVTAQRNFLTPALNYIRFICLGVLCAESQQGRVAGIGYTRVLFSRYFLSAAVTWRSL